MMAGKLRYFGVIFSLAAAGIGVAAAGVTEVVEIDLKVHRPELFSVEVPFSEEVGEVRVGADFPVDWRWVRTGERQGRVEFSPDVSRPEAAVSGQITVEASGGEKVFIPVRGRIRPWVESKPARWAAGPMVLDEGLKEKTIRQIFVLKSEESWWEIGGVRSEGLEGMRCEWERISPVAWRVAVCYDLKETLAGKTVAQLMKGHLRVETTVREQPVVWIPVSLILTVEERKKEGFVWRGAGRWQGDFATPNQAAAFLLPWIGCAAGGVLWVGRMRLFGPASKGGVMGVVGVFFLGMVWLLAQTYSRGGWVGLVVGGCFLAWILPKQRWWIFAGLAVCVGVIAWQPAGVERMASAVYYGEDRSATHRMEVWKATLHMIADHPWGGVGEREFESELKAWYQPGELKYGYTMALSDPLTVAGYGGLPLLALVGGVIFSVLIPAILMVRRGGNVLVGGSIAGVIAVLVAGCFSYLLHLWFVAKSAVVVAGGVVVWMVVEKGRKAGFFGVLRGVGIAVMGGMAGGVLLACGVLVLAIGVKGQALTRHRSVGDPAGGKDGWVIEPGSGEEGKGNLLVILGRKEEGKSLAREELRPLAQEGWRVWVYPPSGSVEEEVRMGEVRVRALGASGEGVALYGRREGGTAALLLGSSLRVQSLAVPVEQIFAWQPAYESALEEWSPLANVGRLVAAVQLLHEEGPGDWGMQEALRYQAEAEKCGKDVEIRWRK